MKKRLATYIKNQNYYKTNFTLFVIAFLILGVELSFGQTQLHQESFETDGEGVRYISTTHPAPTADEFFERLGDSDSKIDQIATPVAGADGSSIWALGGLQNVDATAGTGTNDEVLLTIDDISIANYSSLNIDLLIASNSASEFENIDYLIVEIDIDNTGTYTIIGAFYGAGAGSTRFRRDTNLDGSSTDQAASENIDETLTNKNFTIAGTGSLLDLRIRAKNSSDVEQMAFDNIRLNGTNPAPSISSIARKTPLSTTTNAASIEFLVTFDESVNPVVIADFSLDVTGVSGTSITSVSAGPSTTFTVTVNTGTDDGSIQLDLNDADNTILSVDNSSTLTSNTFTTGEVYTIDKSAPTASAPTAGAQTLKSGDVSTSTIQSTEDGNIYLVKNGVAAASQTNINDAITANNAFEGKNAAVAATPYTVTVAASLNDGVYDIVAVDNAGNVSSIISGWLTVDNTAPTASAPTAGALTLKSGDISTSTVQSTEDGNIYLVKNGVAAASQANIDAAILANNGFEGKNAAVAATPYTVTVAASLNDGVYDIVAVDNVGNVSSIIGGWLTVDNTAPTASAPTASAQTLKSGDISSSTIQSTENGNIFLVKNGVAAASQANIDAAILANDAFEGTNAATAATPYTVTVAASLNDGVYDIVAVDNAGNISSIIGGWLTVDNTPPSFASATIDYNNGILVVTLDEGVDALSAVDATKFYISNTSGGNDIPLTEAEETGFDEGAKTITFTLTEAHRNSAIAISGTAGGDATPVLLDMDVAAVSDPTGNTSLLSNGNTVTETADTTIPIVSTPTSTPQTLKSGDTPTSTVQSTENGSIYFVLNGVAAANQTNIDNAITANNAFLAKSNAIANTEENVNTLPASLNDGLYDIVAVDNADNVSALLGGWLTVDNTAPTFQSAIAVSRTLIQIKFSEPISIAQANGSDFTSPGLDFTVDVGGAIINVGDNTMVDLAVTDLIVTNFTSTDLSVAINAVSDGVGNGNAVVAGASITDEIAPEFISATTTTTSNIQITFSEALNNVDFAKFTSTGIDFIASAAVINIDPTKIDLTIDPIATDFNSTDLDIATNAVLDASPATNSIVAVADRTVSDGLAPTISPDEISVVDATTIEFIISEELNIIEGGAVTGLGIAGIGTFTSAIYSGKGTTNLITIAGAGFVGAATTVTYTSGGTGLFKDLNGIEIDDGVFPHATIVNVVNLGPGDIAFTTFNTKGGDGWSFVLLKDIPTGTLIKFTDNGWRGATIKLTTDETTVSWIAATQMFAGTEVSISESSNVRTVSHGTLDPASGGMSFGDKKESLLAYQGSASTPTFLAGIHLSSDGTEDGTTLWNTVASSNGDNDRSALPTVTELGAARGLTNGINAISFSANVVENVKYTGTKTGINPVSLGTAINDSPANEAASWDDRSNGTARTLDSGNNYNLPPDIQSTSPTHSTTVGKNLNTLVFEYDATEVMSLSNGNITLWNDARDTQLGIWNTITHAAQFSIVNNVITLDISDQIIFSAANDGLVYEVDIDEYTFENVYVNHNRQMLGDGSNALPNDLADMKFTIDGVIPTVNSINRDGTTTGLNASFGTASSTVKFTVTFSENVAGVDLGDFYTSGSASGGGETIAVTGSNDIYTVTVSGITKLGDITVNFNTASSGSATDVPGNPVESNRLGDQTITIINPEPGSQATVFAALAGANHYNMNLSYTAGASGQAEDGYLIYIKSSSIGSFPSAPTDLITVANDLDFSDGIGVLNTTSTTPTIAGMLSGTTYNFIIYTYTNSGNQIDYKTDGTPVESSGTTSASSLTVLTSGGSSTPTISSVNNLLDIGDASSFTFSVIEDGISGDLFNLDDAPTRISALTITEGISIGTAVNDWGLAINEVELSDSDGNTQTANITVNASDITITNIANSIGELGYVTDAKNGIPSAKTFYLKISLKPDMTTLKNEIDGENFVFQINEADITYGNNSSSIINLTSINSGSASNSVSVTASKLEYIAGLNPVDIAVGADFPTPPQVQALDANNNRDLGYNAAVTIGNNALLGMHNNAPAIPGWTDGIFIFPSNFSFTQAANGVTVSVSSGILTPASFATIDVKISNTTTIVGGTTASGLSSLATNRLLDPLLGDPTSGKLVYDFVITDDFGLTNPTNIDVNDTISTQFNQLVIVPKAGNNEIDWANGIQDAYVLDVLNTRWAFATSITSSAITFSSLTTTAGNVGYVADGTAKTYQLYILLKGTVAQPYGGTLQNDIDNLNFDFQITDTNISLVANSSTFTGTEDVNSGQVPVDVIATDIEFAIAPSTQPLSTANYETTLGTIPVATARDIHNTRDKDYNATINVTNADALAMTNNTVSITNGVITLNSGFIYNVGGANGATGTLTFTDAGNGLISATTIPITLSYSNESLIKVAGYAYDIDIPYENYQENIDIVNSGTSIVLEQFTLQDGDGVLDDDDGTPTVLNDLQVQVTNWENLRRIALFSGDGSTELASVGINEQIVTSGIVDFTGLSLTAPDNGSIDFTIRASFHGDDYDLVGAMASDTKRDPGAVDDNEVISFTILSAIESNVNSQFALADASGATSDMTLDENRIEVSADRAIFTYDMNNIAASTFTELSNGGKFIVLKAKDLYFSTDTDYSGTIGAVSTQNFTPTPSLTFENNPTGNFTAGVYDFATMAPTFHYTSDGQAGELIIATASLSDAVSITHDVFASEDSYIRLKTPTIANLNYIIYPPAGSMTSTNSAQLAEFEVVDGDGSMTADIIPIPANPDVDGGATSLESITISLTNISNLDKVGIFDETNNLIGVEQTAATSMTFSGLSGTISAPDITAGYGTYTFSFRATFKTDSASVFDNQEIHLTISTAVNGGGSKFSAIEGDARSTIGGIIPESVAGSNLIEVTANHLEFSRYSDISEIEGKNTTLKTEPEIRALDANLVRDLDHNFIGNITTPQATTSATSLPFVQGIMSFSGFQYTGTGKGTITAISNGLTLSPPPTNLDVFNVDVIGINGEVNGVLTSDLTASFKNLAVLGFKMTTNYAIPAGPILDSIRVDFGNDLSESIEKISLYKTNDPRFNIESITDVPTLIQSINTPSGTFIDFKNLNLIFNTNPINLFIVVDVKESASAGAKKLTPVLVSNGTGLNGGSFATLPINRGFTYGFIDFSAPIITTVFPAHNDLTVDYSTLTSISVDFNEPVFYNPGSLKLIRKIQNNTVNDTIFLNEPVISGLPQISWTFTLRDDPLIVLAPDTRYYVIINPLDGFVDVSGNGYEGITTNDVWSFRTADETPPIFITDPIEENNLPAVVEKFGQGFNFRIQLDEPGIVYYKVVKNNATPLNNVDILPPATADGFINVANGYEDVFGTYIDQSSNANDDYYIYFSASDEVGNEYAGVDNAFSNAIIDIGPSSTTRVISELADVLYCVNVAQALPPITLIEKDANNEFSDGKVLISLPSGFVFDESIILSTIDDANDIDGAQIDYSGTGLSNLQYATGPNSTSVSVLSFDFNASSGYDYIIIKNLKVKALASGISSRVFELGGNLSLDPTDESAFPKLASVDGSNIFNVNFTSNPPGPSYLNDPQITIALNPVITFKDSNVPADEDLIQSLTFTSSIPIQQDNVLIPEFADLGANTIALTMVDINGCTETLEKNVTIFDAQEGVSGLERNYCLDIGVSDRVENGFGIGTATPYRLDTLYITSFLKADLTDSVLTVLVPALVKETRAGDVDDYYYFTATDLSREMQVGGIKFIGEYTNLANFSKLTIEQNVKLHALPEPSFTIDSKDVSEIDFCVDTGIIRLSGTNVFDSLYSEFVATSEYFLTDLITGIPVNGLSDNEDGSATIASLLTGTGSYNIEFRITSAANCITSINKTIHIHSLPQTTFTFGLNANNEDQCAGLEVDFYNGSSVAVVTDDFLEFYTWTIEDDNNPQTVNTSNAVHTFDLPGSYNVTLNNISSYGCQTSQSQEVQIGDIPIPAFTHTEWREGFETILNQTNPFPIGETQSVAWQFESGEPDIIVPQNEFSDYIDTILFSGIGRRNVTLTVASKNNCIGSATKSLFVLPVIKAPYSDNFSTDIGWIGDGTNSTWELATPQYTIIGIDTFIIEAFDGNSAWITNAEGGYLAQDTSYLYSPSFDLTALDRPMISFQSFIHTSEADGVVLQYSYDTGKTWQRLGDRGLGVNWYNRDKINSEPGEELGTGWAGLDSLWRNSIYTLNDLNRNNFDNVIFRFAFASTNAGSSDGFAIDDMYIGERSRIVLIENFVNVNEKSSARETNFVMNGLNGLGIEYIAINYHTSIPELGPFSSQGTIDSDARALYYNIAEVPEARLDGRIPLENQNKGTKSIENWGDFEFEKRALNEADVEINIDSIYNNNDLVNIEISITTSGIGTSLLNEATIVHAAIVEHDITLAKLGLDNTPPSEENNFSYVLKKMLPSATGTRVDPNNVTTINNTSTFKLPVLKWNPLTVYDLNSLSLIVFVQKENEVALRSTNEYSETREVYQAAIKNLVGLGITTGVNDEINIDNVNLYPNPASKVVNLEFPMSKTKKSIAVYNSLGREVLNDMIPPREYLYKINTEEFTPGVYVVQMIEGEYIIRRRFIIQHH